jgi:NADH:ubiquinone oxidoreductase subunit 3 (subunit A)
MSNNVETILLSPPVAFLINLALVGLLSWIGRRLSAPVTESEGKSSTYASGEAPPVYMAAPGYRPFFAVALFFAILHLGALTLGSSQSSIISGIFLGGLLLALLALILG